MEPLSAIAITALAFISITAAETAIAKFTESALEKANNLIREALVIAQSIENKV